MCVCVCVCVCVWQGETAPAGGRRNIWGAIPNEVSGGDGWPWRGPLRGPGLGGRSQEGLFWAEQSAGPGLAVKAGPALPSRRGRGVRAGNAAPRGPGRGFVGPALRAGSQ